MTYDELQTAKFGLMEDVKQLLEDNGFTQMQGADYRYMERGDLQISNCPHN